MAIALIVGRETYSYSFEWCTTAVAYACGKPTGTVQATVTHTHSDFLAPAVA